MLVNSLFSFRSREDKTNADTGIVKAPELAPVPAKMLAPRALKPDGFQEFPLKEKTVLSHNVAM